MNPEVLTFFLNEIVRTLGLIDPTWNSYIGQSEPPSTMLTDGRLAYADGTNWNPDSGGKGLYRYDGGTSAWVKVG